MKHAKKLLCLLLTLCMVVGMFPMSALAAGNLPFTDVRVTDWFYDEVQFVYENELMGGTGNGKFSPNATTTRGMIVTILHRMEGQPLASGLEFDDVADGQYYTDAVKWASENGIVGGYGNGKFGPNDPITREQMAAILYRYAQVYAYDTSISGNLSAFADDEKVSDYAVEAMKWAVGMGLISGTTGNRLDPTGTATRAQIAAILARFCEEYKLFASAFLPIIPNNNGSDDSSYTVAFDSNGGSSVATQEVKHGEHAEIPAEPEKNGHLFAGWFLNVNESDWTKSFDFENEAIVEDLTLYAIWVDSTTDSDSDGLFDDLEDYIGTDKYNADTDADGLDDYQEKILFNYDPLNKDSDADGCEDPDEDYDNDGLTNIKEDQIGTNPILVDTDLDGLTDGEEKNNYGTDPTKEDTDGDGASDGDEVRLGTDPLTANTFFTEKATNDYGLDSQDVIVEVTTDVSGAQVGTLNIEPVSSSENPSISPLIPGFIDYGVDITIEGSIDRAQLTFKYDTDIGTLGADFQPRIYYFNETTKLFEELPNQTVSNGVVSTTINHFSTYILLNKVEFDKVWNEDIKKPIVDSTGTVSGIDVVFAIDVSGSMDYYDRLSTAKVALQTFLDALEETDRAALVSFSTDAELLCDLTTDKEVVSSYISGLEATWTTSMYKGLDTSIDLLTDDTQTYGYKMVILLSDGKDEPETTYQDYYADLVQTAKENNIVVYTIGVGNGIDASTMIKVADETGGAYYHATQSSQITDVFEELQEETIDLTADLNGDKIPDYYNELIRTGDLVPSNGSLEFIGRDFNYDENGDLCADFDGDGVLNGDELKVITNGVIVYLDMISDPMKADSDNDGYDDNTENSRGTDPRVPTYPASCINPLMNDGQWTHEYITEEQDGEDWARSLWSSVTFNWSHVDEAKSVLTYFFDEYSNMDSVENVQEEIANEVADQLGQSLIAGITEDIKDFSKVPGASVDVINAGANAVLAVKKWQSSGRMVAGFVDPMTKIKAHIGQFKHIYHPEKIEIDCVSRFDKFMGGFNFVAGTVNDIGESIEAYSLLIATGAAFEESYDVLNKVAENDDLVHGYVAKAAEEIIDTLRREENSYFNTASRDFGYLIVENAASFAATLLESNPYVKAITLAVDLLDTFTPATEIAEAGYRLFVIDKIVEATKDLFEYTSKTSSFYNLENTQTRHVELLICARMWGNEFAEIITSAQHYWGLFNDNKIREKYKAQINDENVLLQNCLDWFM